MSSMIGVQYRDDDARRPQPIVVIPQLPISYLQRLRRRTMARDCGLHPHKSRPNTTPQSTDAAEIYAPVSFSAVIVSMVFLRKKKLRHPK